MANFNTIFKLEEKLSIFFTLKNYNFFENFLKFVKKYDMNNFLHLYFKNIFFNFIQFSISDFYFSAIVKDKDNDKDEFFDTKISPVENFNENLRNEILFYFFEELKILDFIIDTVLLDTIKFEGLLHKEINTAFFSNLLNLGEGINNLGNKSNEIKLYLNKGKF